jgi:hypothetical protein
MLYMTERCGAWQVATTSRECVQFRVFIPDGPDPKSRRSTRPAASRGGTSTAAYRSSAKTRMPAALERRLLRVQIRGRLRERDANRVGPLHALRGLPRPERRPRGRRQPPPGQRRAPAARWAPRLGPRASALASGRRCVVAGVSLPAPVASDREDLSSITSWRRSGVGDGHTSRGRQLPARRSNDTAARRRPSAASRRVVEMEAASSEISTELASGLVRPRRGGAPRARRRGGRSRARGPTGSGRRCESTAATSVSPARARSHARDGDSRRSQPARLHGARADLGLGDAPRVRRLRTPYSSAKCSRPPC